MVINLKTAKAMGLAMPPALTRVMNIVGIKPLLVAIRREELV
jgi:hypothetical protein